MFKWEDKIDKPMNENAEADFKEAIEEAAQKTAEAQAKAYSKCATDMPADAAEHKNKAVLEWRTNGAWQDFVAILLNNGYDVEIKHPTMYVTDVIEISWGDK